MKQAVIEALPHTLEQIVGAVLVIVTSILAAFRQGKRSKK